MQINIRKIINFVSLKFESESHEHVALEIEKGVVFKGTNLWILVFAIVVASVGLNTNSTAVIIGAMLISPLMGPINGIGFAVATFDYPLFIKSIKNFGFAVIASLIASTIYFSLSPVSVAQSELLARINPTIYDVIIALFGGLAGIVAISSKLKGNVLPGVAIATALMPPLCTAGYGLATGQFKFFFGAFYLFAINTVFISISTVITVKLLNFPVKNILNASTKNRVNIYLVIVLLITLIPSVYFGYKFVQNEKKLTIANEFCVQVTSIEGAYLIKNEIDVNERTITLTYGGKTLSKKEKDLIQDKIDFYKLNDFKVKIHQGFAFDTQALSDKDNFQLKLQKLSSSIDYLKNKNDSLQNVNQFGKEILSEIHTIFPQIISCSYANSTIFMDSTTQNQPIDLVYFQLNKEKISTVEGDKIYGWLKKKLKKDTLLVFYNF